MPNKWFDRSRNLRVLIHQWVRGAVNSGVRCGKKKAAECRKTNDKLAARAGFLTPDTEVGRGGDGASDFLLMGVERE